MCSYIIYTLNKALRKCSCKLKIMTHSMSSVCRINFRPSMHLHNFPQKNLSYDDINPCISLHRIQFPFNFIALSTVTFPIYDVPLQTYYAFPRGMPCCCLFHLSFRAVASCDLPAPNLHFFHLF